MNAKAIIDKKFERSKSGYDVEQVDEFLRDVSIEFSELQTQNESLEKKLEVLADKIREYREDEEAIKDALLGAQKQGARVIAEAKEKAEALVTEATEKSEQLIKEAEEKSVTAAKEATEKADSIIAEAEKSIVEKTALAKKITEEAEITRKKLQKENEDKLAEITAKIDAEIKKEEEILAKTRAESANFTDRLLSVYKTHIELLKSIPEDIDNEFTKAVAAKHENEAPVETKSEIQLEVVEEPAVEEVIKEAPTPEPIKVVEDEVVIEPVKKSQTQPIPFQPIFEEAPNESDVDIFETRELPDPDEDDSPFFNKNKHHSNYEKLEFGKK